MPVVTLLNIYLMYCPSLGCFISFPEMNHLKDYKFSYLNILGLRYLIAIVVFAAALDGCRPTPRLLVILTPLETFSSA